MTVTLVALSAWFALGLGVFIGKSMNRGKPVVEPSELQKEQTRLDNQLLVAKIHREHMMTPTREQFDSRWKAETDAIAAKAERDRAEGGVIAPAWFDMQRLASMISGRSMDGDPMATTISGDDDDKPRDDRGRWNG